MADSDSNRVQALRIGALPALLRLLNISSKKHKAMQEAVADGVAALMMGELKGEGMEEAATARTRALPLLTEAMVVTKVDAVRERLAAVSVAFSLVAA